MSIFKKPFSRSKTGESLKFAALLRESEAEVNNSLGPLNRLALTIIKASNNCWESTQPLICETDQNRLASKTAILLYEYIYFFMHLTMRAGFQLSFSQTKIAVLQQFLQSAITSPAIDTFFKGRSPELKEELRSEFLDNLNAAELDYSTSKELIPKGAPALSAHTLMTKLVVNVEEAIGGHLEGDSLKLLSQTVLDEIAAADLFEEVKGVSATLDSPETVSLVQTIWEMQV